MNKFAQYSNLIDLSENLIISAMYFDYILFFFLSSATLNDFDTLSYFEKTACEVFKIFDANSDDYQNGKILLQKVPYY